MPSGITATTPDDLVLNVAVIYIGATKLGATQGGLDFDPGAKRRQIEYDGRATDVAELEYVTEYDAVIKGKFIQLSSTLIDAIEMGNTSGTSGTPVVTTYTPIDANVRYAAGDYLTNLKAVWTRGDGSLFTVTFPTSKVEKYKLDSKDKRELIVDVEFKAVLSLTAAVANSDAAPFTLSTTAAA